MKPVGVCVKVSSLRPRYDNLEEFLNDPSSKNVLVCRRGRVWITNSKTGVKKIFTYRDSHFANPFRVGEKNKPGYYSLSESLRLYREHLDKILEDADTKKQFLDLATKDRVGCFCDTGSPCHRDVIIEKLASLHDNGNQEENLEDGRKKRRKTADE